MARGVKKYKKGQMKMSFGMIFAIFLIIAFLIMGFLAINKFLSFQKNVQTSQFIENLQKDVTNAYSSQQASTVETYPVPSNIERVCFVKSDYNNLEIDFKKTLKTKEANIDHLDLNNTFSGGQDKICANATDGKVSIKLTKPFNEPLVTVKV